MNELHEWSIEDIKFAKAYVDWVNTKVDRKVTGEEMKFIWCVREVFDESQ